MTATAITFEAIGKVFVCKVMPWELGMYMPFFQTNSILFYGVTYQPFKEFQDSILVDLLGLDHDIPQNLIDAVKKMYNSEDVIVIDQSKIGQVIKQEAKNKAINLINKNNSN